MVLSIVAAVVVIATCGSFIWLLKRKKRAEMEVRVFVLWMFETQPVLETIAANTDR